MPTSNVVADSGKVCYKNVPGASFPVNTCISYGELTANGPLPIAGSFSLSRVGNVFELGPAAPRNNSNDVGCLGSTGDLAVTKTADPEPVGLGSGNLTYTISVSTCSPNGVTGVVVTDTLPLDVNFVSATPGCTGTATVTCVLGTMTSGDVATVTIVVTPTAVGNLNNTASVTGDQVDPNTGDNTATVTTTVNIPPPGEVEPNDPIASAQFLTIPASGTAEIAGILGTIGGINVDDLDFFSFLGNFGDVVTIDIDNAIGGAQSFDSQVALFGPGPSFNFLIQDDDSPIDPGSTSGLDSRIDDFTLPSTGIFAVVVTSCCRGFQDGGVVGPGTVRNGDYILIISGVTPTPVTGGPPSPPDLLFPEDGAFLNDSTPVFDWEASSGDVADFRLLATSGDINAGPFDIDVVISGDATQFAVPTGGALADGTYQWRVIAVDGALNTASSVTRSFTVDTLPPSRPANLTEVTTGDEPVRVFTWDGSVDPAPPPPGSGDGSGVDFYNVVITGPQNVVTTADDSVIVCPAGICQFTTPALTAGQYTINVNAVDRATNQGLPATADFRAGLLQLVSIAVTPEAASVPVGLTQQFTAIGSFSDGSTADVTAAATWESTTTQVFPTLVGAAGGPALAVAHGTVGGVPHVFYGSWPHLVAADVSDPANPVEVGRLLLPDVVNGLFFREADSLLFVANDDDGGLRIVDVSTPSAPVEVGSAETPGFARDVFVTGDLAYVAASGQLRIVDVSNPSAPVEVGSADNLGTAFGVVVSGDLAFVAAGGLRILDVSDPAIPVEVGLFSTGGARGLFLSGDLAFIAAGDGKLRIVDVSNPTAPVQVGSADTPGLARDVFISGDLAFVAAFGSGLRVFDVFNPSAPAEVGFLDTPGASRDVLVFDDLAFVADTGGVRIIEVSDPAAPAQVGFLDTPGSAHDLVVSGDMAFVADGGTGLSIMDVSDPAGPLEVGFLDTPGSAWGVVVSGDLAFVADGDSGLRIIDVSNHTTPVEVSSADTVGNTFRVVVSGDLAFVADRGSGLRIIDVSDPSAPAEVGSADTPGLAFGVFVTGDLAFVADFFNGLRIIDVSDPSVPVEVGSAGTQGIAIGIVVSGDLAFVADIISGLRIIDVSIPAGPVLVGSLALRSSTFGVAVSGDLAFVGGRGSGLRIVDVSNPTTPVELGFLDTPPAPLGIVISGDLAFVADIDGGLLVVDVGTTVATITSGGLATGLRPGTAGITATLNGITGDATLTVTGPAQLVSIAVTPESPSVTLGTSQQFTATGDFTDGSTADLTSSVTWASSNPLVVTVSTGGLATAVGVGTADISATSGDVMGSTMLTVPSAPLVGHVVLEGDSRPDTGFLVEVTVSFFTPGTEPFTGAAVAVRLATTSLVPVPRMAEFLIPDAPVGTFHVTVSSDHTLASVVRDVSIGPTGETVNFRNLHEGDADANHIVDLRDFAILAAAYGTCLIDGGFDVRADFDRNGCVSISDFGLLSIHFEEQSPIGVT